MLNNLSIKNGLTDFVFQNGYDVLSEKGIAIIWMSVGNSYFKPDVIFELLSFCTHKFKEIKILIPFEPAQYTYQALGNNEHKALTKARLNSNRLKNHTEKIIQKIGAENFEVVSWGEKIHSHPEYRKQLNYINNLYVNKPDFKIDCNNATKQVLETKNKFIKNTDIEIGVKYLLEELAFVLASPLIFDVPKTAYIYHKHWLVYEKLVNGVYDNISKEKIGFLLIK